MTRFQTEKIKKFNSTNIFESMRSYNGKIFKLDEHLARLKESAKTTALDPHRQTEIKKLIMRRFKESRLKNAYIRVALNNSENGKVNISIIIKELKRYSPGLYEKGICLRTSAIKRNSIESLNPRIKSSNFLPGILAKTEADKIFDVLLLNNRGYVTEATTSNVFIVKTNVIYTPAASCGILKGITRDVVLTLAEDLGISIKKTHLTRHDLFTADECFLTNTSMEIMPVVEIDGRKIGSGRPGELTKTLIQNFKKLTVLRPETPECKNDAARDSGQIFSRKWQENLEDIWQK